MQESLVLPHDIVIEFRCGDYANKQPVMHREALPAQAEGLVFHRANLLLDATFSLSLKSGSDVIRSVSDQKPSNWKDPLRDLAGIYDSFDKGVISKVPLLGKAVEAMLPDARWHHDLWYNLYVNEAGVLSYKVHFGPTSDIGVRYKLEGEYRLL